MIRLYRGCAACRESTYERRREFALTGRPGHEREMRAFVRQTEALRVLPVLFNPDAPPMENGLVDLLAILLLQNARDREQGALTSRAEPVKEVLAEDPRNNGRVGRQLLGGSAAASFARLPVDMETLSLRVVAGAGFEFHFPPFRKPRRSTTCAANP